MKHIILLALLLLWGLTMLVAAPASDPVPTITISEATHINEAIQIIESVAWQYDRRKLINMSSFNANIGIPVNALPWKQALQIIALKNNLEIVELAGYTALTDIATKKEQTEGKKDEPRVEGKQVRIRGSVIFVDRAYLNTLGIDWSTVLNGKVNANLGYAGAQNVTPEGLNITYTKSTARDGIQIDINTLLRAIESNQKGSVLAKPDILVSSGKKGFIQVGQDFSVKAIDEAGNTIDMFYATGVILDVVPTIIVADSLEVVHLTAMIERSSATPGTISTIINKSKSSTELILYNGEEAVIGGLYDTDEIKIRSGIPFLKDLPWWVLGIRYLAGYDKLERKERELIIILKVEIVDGVKDRFKRAQEIAAQELETALTEPDNSPPPVTEPGLNR